MTFGLCKAGGGGGGGDFQEKKGGKRRKFPASTFMGNATESVQKRKVLLLGSMSASDAHNGGQKPFLFPPFQKCRLASVSPFLGRFL